MPLIKLSVSEKRRLQIFITCLVLASAAWLLNGLSSNYNFRVKGVLTYKNTPQARAFHSLQSDTVDVTLQGTGWQMLFSTMNNSIRYIPVDMHTLDHQNYIILDKQLPSINNIKDANQRIVAVNPDTLYFDFTKRLSKKVPVQLVANVDYQHQYALSNAITVKPAYVTVSGPANQLSTITSWKTDSLKLSAVNATVNTRVNLLPVHESNVSVYPRVVQVQVPVDEFTEKTLEIPVKLVNNTRYLNVKLFPQKVKVTFTVSLSRYKETDEDYFDALADLQLWEKEHYSVLPVKLSRIPSFCKIVRIEPSTIDFIVNK